MRTVADKEILVAADYSGFPLKEAIVAHLKEKGWKVTDVGLHEQEEQPREMFHRIGFRVGALITEGEFERALVFCGTGMGIHIAASKCPGVRAGVVESVPAGLRAAQANNVNVLAMGGFYVAPQMGIDIAEAYLCAKLGEGEHDWPPFYAFHKLADDEINAFDYAAYKENGFQVVNPRTMEDYAHLIPDLPYSETLK